MCGIKTPTTRSFCSDMCEKDYLVGTDTSYLRREIWNRDQGVCKTCGVNTLLIRVAYVNERIRRRLAIKASEKDELVTLLEQLGFHTSRGVPITWNVDHIVPISKGGSLTMDNSQTLCVPCHKLKTKKEREANLP